jgi:hypothetical protein
MSVPNVFDIRPPNHARRSNCNNLDAIRRTRASPERRVHTGQAAGCVLHCTYSPISLSYHHWRVVFATETGHSQPTGLSPRRSFTCTSRKQTIMKRNRARYLATLVIGIAMPSPNVMAQSAPAAAATQPPLADTTASRSSANLPDPPPILAYSRPTEKEKLQLLALNAFGPLAFAEAGLAGGIQQETKSPPEWGSGWDGYGKRVGSSFGVEFVTTTTRYGIAEIFREDDVYYPSQRRGFFPRVGHAVISTLTGRRGAEGSTTFSPGGLISPYAGSMTALAWYPHRYGLKDGFRMGNYNLASQAGGNLWLEFIYGGPHTLFGHLRHLKSQDQAATVHNP